MISFDGFKTGLSVGPEPKNSSRNRHKGPVSAIQALTTGMVSMAKGRIKDSNRLSPVAGRRADQKESMK